MKYLSTIKLKFWLSFLFCFLSSITVFSQSSKYLRKPDFVDYPNGKLPENIASTIPKKGDPWIVYSDRSNNIINVEPSSSSGVAKKIGFGVPFYVLSVTPDNWFEVCEFSTDNAPKANSLGFIHASKLLLWNKVVYNNGFSVKVLALITDDEILRGDNIFKYFLKSEEQGEGKVKVYDHPLQNEDYLNGKQMSLFSIYYKLKSENGMVLVANDYTFAAVTSSQALIGWVPEKIVSEWESRLCLEPNLSKSAVNERKAQKIKIPIFKKEGFNDAAAYVKGAAQLDSVSVFDHITREIPLRAEQTRYPLLGGLAGYKSKEKLYNLGYISDVFPYDSLGNPNNNSNVDSKEKADSTRNVLNKQLETSSRINIIFVIDGSVSMTVNMEDVKRGLQELKLDLSNEVKKELSFDFAAVLYRNHKEGQCGGKVVSEKEFTPNLNSIYDWFDKETSVPPCVKAIGTGSSLRLGLMTAMKLFENYKKQDQSNYIILVGGPGDDTPSTSIISYDNLSKAYSDCGVNLFSYQFVMENSPIFEYFFDDLEKISREANDQMFLATRKNRFLGVKEREKFEWQKSEETLFKRLFIKENTRRVKFAEITYPNAKSSGILPGSVYTNDISQLLNRIVKFNLDAILGLRTLIDGIYVSTNNDLTGAQNWMLRNTSKEAIQFLKKKKFQFIAEGYAPKTREGLTQDMFNRTLFFTSDELSTLRTDFRNFILASDNMEKFRDEAYKSCMKLAKTYFGENTSQERLKTITGKELFGKFVGIDPPANSFFSKLSSFEDVKNTKKISGDDLRELSQTTSAWIDLLDEVESSPKYRWVRGKKSYFWVPEKLFKDKRLPRDE